MNVAYGIQKGLLGGGNISLDFSRTSRSFMDEKQMKTLVMREVRVPCVELCRLGYNWMGHFKIMRYRVLSPSVPVLVFETWVPVLTSPLIRCVTLR